MNMRISRLNTGLAAAFLGISLLLSGCAQTEESQGAFDASPEAAGKLKVAVTLFPYYDFVRQIAGDQVDLQMVIPAGMDSHSFEPTPADIRTIQHADVLISNGGTMEHWLDETLAALDTTSMTIVTMMDYVDTVEEEIVMTMITPMSMRQMITITVMKHRRSTQPMRTKRMTMITWIMTVMRKKSSMTSTSGLLR